MKGGIKRGYGASMEGTDPRRLHQRIPRLFSCQLYNGHRRCSVLKLCCRVCVRTCWGENGGREGKEGGGGERGIRVAQQALDDIGQRNTESSSSCSDLLCAADVSVNYFGLSRFYPKLGIQFPRNPPHTTATPATTSIVMTLFSSCVCHRSSPLTTS